MITGQLVFRESGIINGKRIMTVVGILAIPDEDIKGEHQYTVSGDRDNLTIHRENKDISDLSIGFGLGQLITHPIWRI